jgi:hypothetical protein
MKIQKIGLLFIFSLASFLQLSGQKDILIKGKITDAETGEALPFATVSYIGNESVGTTTDFDGYYEFSSKWGTDSIQASFVGYLPQSVKIDKSKKSQTIDFRLNSQNITLVTAEVKARKERYKRKNNPAVELIKKVMKNKDKNRLEGQDYAEYEQYEKVELALNNITEEFKQKKYLRKFQFLFDFVDTSEVNGKPYLPIYIKEIASKVYYQKSPQKKKEYQEGVKVSGMEDYLLTDNIGTLTDYLYQDIDIYDNNILLFGKSFISPLSSVIGNAFYRYYIIDTIQYKGLEVIDLAFMPNNKQDIGFKGNLYILNDSTYAVVKADLGLTKQANINWVNDLKLTQEFVRFDDFWILNKDKIVADFALLKKSRGFFGSRTVHYRNHLFNQPKNNSFYEGSANAIELKGATKKSEAYWTQARHEPLNQKEIGIYKMVDTLQTVPAFKNAMNIFSTLVSGYWRFDKVEIGPVGAFYSFNDVEGFRLRFGGGTTTNFHPKLQLEGYAAYGFKDQRWKYAGSVLYSFNEKYRDNPRHFIKASYQHETNFAGQNLQFVAEDNFFLSFKRGNSSRMLFNDAFKLNYQLETRKDWGFGLNFKHETQSPLGSLKFNRVQDPNSNLPLRTEITTTEVGVHFRWAPNEQFVQGHDYRIPIFNQHPVFNLRFAQGLNGVLGGDFNYQRLSVDIFKRFYLSPIGMTDMLLEGGKIWGKGLPYFSLLVPRGNQTYAYQDAAFNMMNFLEFTSDAFVSWNIQHYFNGFIFNKLPLLKKLKLREVITFKGVWGSLSDANNPNIDTDLIPFTINEAGQLETFALGSEPYMEASFGVMNIFKFGRVDLVKRLNYLDNPNVPQLFGSKGLGIRFMIKFEF